MTTTNAPISPTTADNIAALLRAHYHQIKISYAGNQSAQPLRDRFKACPNVFFSQADVNREPNAWPTLCRYGVIDAQHKHARAAITNALTYLSKEGFLLALVDSDYYHHDAETLQTWGVNKLIKIDRH